MYSLLESQRCRRGISLTDIIAEAESVRQDDLMITRDEFQRMMCELALSSGWNMKRMIQYYNHYHAQMTSGKLTAKNTGRLGYVDAKSDATHNIHAQLILTHSLTSHATHIT